jgi:hypothetical protein
MRCYDERLTMDTTVVCKGYPWCCLRNFVTDLNMRQHAHISVFFILLG